MRSLSLIGEYFRMAWHALWAHKLRSSLTTLGILIGVTTIITIFTTIQGLNDYVIGQLSSIGSSTIYVEKFPWVIKGDFWKYRNRKEVTYDEFEALQKHLRLAKAISPQVLSFRTAKYKTEAYDRIMVIGTNDEYQDTDNIAAGSGRLFTPLDIDRNHYVCVLGEDIAGNLFKNEDPIGKRIKLGSEKFKVIGVKEHQGRVFGQSMDNYIIVPYGTFHHITSGFRGMRIAIQAMSVNQLEDLKEEVRGILRKERKIGPGEEDDFAINQQDQLTDTYKALTQTLFMIIFVIGAISLVVGGIGITNIMLVSVTERTREIGIRKAIGARRKNILSQFLIESVAISSVGGIIGILFGYLAGSMVLSLMELTTGVSFQSIVIGYGFSTLVGVAAGFYPAWKAANMNPIDSLHYE